jgi:hypothetical protein
MGVGDLLDETFRLYRQHFGAFVGLGAVFLLPGFLLGLVLRLAPTRAALSGAELVLTWLLGLLLYAAMITASSEAALGAAPTVGGAVRGLSGRLRPVLGASLLYSFAPMLMAITLLGLPFAIYFLVAWSFVFQTLLLERLGVRRAFGRSRELVRGGWWRVCGVGLLLFLLVLVIAIGLAVPAIVAQGLDQLLDPSTAEQPTGAAVVLGELTSFVSQVLTDPVLAIGWTLLYYDVRMRKEGFDLELRAHELASAPPVAG